MYTISQIKALAKGTKPWRQYWIDLATLLEQAISDIANLSVGSAPGFGSVFDTRGDVIDTASSATTYTATTTPAPSGSDTIPTGWGKRFIPATDNTGAATLNIGSSEGAVSFKKYVDGAKADLEEGDLLANVPVDFRFDSTHFVIYGNGGDSASSSGFEF